MPKLPIVVAVSALTGAVAGGAVLAAREGQAAPERELITSASLEGDPSATAGTSTQSWAGGVQTSSTASDPAIASAPPSPAATSSSAAPAGAPLIRDGAVIPVGTPAIAAGVETVDMPGATGDVADDSAIFRNPTIPS